MLKGSIESENNKIIKHAKSLKSRKNREKFNQFLIEGVRTIDEAINNNAMIKFILYSEKLYEVNGGQKLFSRVKDKYDVYVASEKIFTMLSETENSQGIISAVQKEEFLLEEIISKENLFILVLDRIQDPGNMGTIIRTAKAVNVDAIILTKGCVDIYNSKTLRATMGALFNLPIIQFDSNYDWLDMLKQSDVKLIASSLSTNNIYLDISYKGKIAIIVGNEANGIANAILGKADEKIKIPMLGKIESLNVTASVAILLYKAIEKRAIIRIV
ncbi:MAG: RNA methyltransferase [Clostridiales bacterium]|nr:RNA methyltransferase [Clostridiales bacterium]